MNDMEELFSNVGFDFNVIKSKSYSIYKKFMRKEKLKKIKRINEN